LAGFRRLRFSFFADEHAPGALRLCDASGAWPMREQDPDPHLRIFT